MSLQYALRILRRYWHICALGLAAGLAAAAVFVLTGVQYSTEALVLVRPQGAVDSSRYAAEPERFLRTQVQILRGDDVMGRAAKLARDDSSPEKFGLSIETSGGVLDDTILVVAKGESAAQSRLRAEAVATAFTRVSNARTSLLKIGSSTSSLSPTRTYAAGGVAGLLLGLAAALATGLLRRPIVGAQVWSASASAADVVFPFELKLREGSKAMTADYVRLLTWMFPAAPVNANVLVAGVDSVHAAEMVVARIQEAARSNGYQVSEAIGLRESTTGRPSPDGSTLNVQVWDPEARPLKSGTAELDVVLCVARRGQTTEGLLQQTLQVLPPARLKAGVLVVSGLSKKASQKK